MSLYVYDLLDNPCKPTVTLGYNTQRQVQYPLQNLSPYGEGEARWNFAFWLRNDLFIFGEDETGALVKDWILANGFFYPEDYDKVRDDHATGKELPLLIHELEYYDEIAEQNIRANGQELVAEFTNWVMYP